MSAQVVTANRLGDGVVVYLDAAGGWSEWIAEARVAPDAAAAKELLSLAEQPEQRVRVVAPYVMDIVVEDGVTCAESKRETIRAQGPTVRRDLGKQAESVAGGHRGGVNDVPLR